MAEMPSRAWQARPQRPCLSWAHRASPAPSLTACASSTATSRRWRRPAAAGTSAATPRLLRRCSGGSASCTCSTRCCTSERGPGARLVCRTSTAACACADDFRHTVTCAGLPWCAWGLCCYCYQGTPHAWRWLGLALRAANPTPPTTSPLLHASRLTWPRSSKEPEGQAQALKDFPRLVSSGLLGTLRISAFNAQHLAGVRKVRTWEGVGGRWRAHAFEFEWP